MQKHISFKAEFKRVLALLGPYIFLLAIGVGAASSRGSWSVFLNESFKMAFFYGILLWLALSLYISIHYKVTGGYPARSGNYVDDDDDELPRFNTNGLPMNGIMDSSGNPFGSSGDD